MALSPQWRWKLDRLRERLQGMFSKPESERRPRLCPACGTLVGASANKCHECGASLTFSIAAASRSLSGLLPENSPATYVIMGINLFMFGVTIMASMTVGGGLQSVMNVSGQVLLRLGARQSYLLIVEGELWRLVLPIFLHGGLLHIFFNSWVLMDIGPQVEEIYGSARYLFLYVVTGIFSFIISTAWNVYFSHGFGISIGASGALMGLVGLMLALTRRRGGAYMQTIRGGLIRWIIMIFLIGFFFNADNAAHAGGLAAGYVLGSFMADREPLNASERNRAYVLGWLAALVVVGSFAAMMYGYFHSA